MKHGNHHYFQGTRLRWRASYFPGARLFLVGANLGERSVENKYCFLISLSKLYPATPCPWPSNSRLRLRPSGLPAFPPEETHCLQFPASDGDGCPGADPRAFPFASINDLFLLAQRSPQAPSEAHAECIPKHRSVILISGLGIICCFESPRPAVANPSDLTDHQLSVDHWLATTGLGLCFPSIRVTQSGLSGT